MNKAALQTIVAQHALWLADSKDGACADLRSADLSSANLSSADLRGATSLGLISATPHCVMFPPPGPISRALTSRR